MSVRTAERVREGFVMGVIPPAASAAFVAQMAQMEDWREVDHSRYDPERPVVCRDVDGGDDVAG